MLSANIILLNLKNQRINKIKMFWLAEIYVDSRIIGQKSGLYLIYLFAFKKYLILSETIKGYSLHKYESDEGKYFTLWLLTLHMTGKIESKKTVIFFVSRKYPFYYVGTTTETY